MDLARLQSSIAAFVAERAVFRNLIASALLIALVMLGRRALLRQLRRTKLGAPLTPLRLTVQLRWLSLLVVVLGLVVIWAQELRTLALSLVAIAAAAAIATKELIMCLAGALVRASSESFEVGDRVEIDGVRGDVIDHRPLTTTLLEIGPGHQRTGRTIVLPNSVLLTQKVINETFADEYVLHPVVLPVRLSELAQVRERALAIAREVCAPYLDEARLHLDASASQHGLTPFAVEPRAIIQLVDPERANLLVRVPVPARERGLLEQKIVERLVLRGDGAT